MQPLGAFPHRLLIPLRALHTEPNTIVSTLVALHLFSTLIVLHFVHTLMDAGFQPIATRAIVQLT